MSKKERRLESKKKKAIAFLNLIESKDLKEGTMEGPAAKKARYSCDNCSTINNCSNSPACAETPGIVPETGLQPSGCESTEEQYARARKAQRELQKAADEGSGRTLATAMKYGAQINLCLENMLPFTDLNDKSKGTLEDRLPPLFVIDLQHLLLLALLKNFSFWTPRWCRLSRPRKLSSVVLIVLQDVSVRDLENHPDSFPFLRKSFLSCVEMVNPVQYSSCVEQDICRVPLLISQLKTHTKREDIRQKIVRLISKPNTTPRKKKECTEKVETANADSQTDESQRPSLEGSEDSFPRTSLLLSSVQLMGESYPMPVDVRNKRYSDYAFSKDSYLPATHSSPMFGVDCEMCQTAEMDFELTRVTVVNEEKEVMYDQLVKPYNEITNYLTRFSGMTEEKLSAVTKRVEDVHKDLKELLPPDAILCGQSLWNDLNALKMFHPYVIDTSIVFNQSGDKKIKCGLRKLAFNFLGRKIQTSKQGHCSIEDAKATVDLVKLKLSKGIEFGDAMLGGVYFPDIKTYFEDPSKAQNVEEVFSAHSTPLSTVSNTCDHSCSSTCLQPSSSKDQQNRSSVCLQSACVGNDSCATARTNGSARCVECESEERADHKAACEGGLCEDVKEQERTGNERLKERSGNCQDSSHQRDVFFQQEGSSVMFDFFEVLADNKCTAGIIGSKELFSRLQPSTQVECVEVDSNAEACSAVERVSQHRDFTWVELNNSFADTVSGDLSADATDRTEKRKHLLAQLNDDVQELVMKLQPKSLIAVMMKGRSDEGQHLNAATFLKIK